MPTEKKLTINFDECILVATNLIHNFSQATLVKNPDALSELTKPNERTLHVFASIYLLDRVRFTLLVSKILATGHLEFNGQGFERTVAKFSEALETPAMLAERKASENKGRDLAVVVHGMADGIFYYSSTEQPDITPLSPAQHTKNYYLSLADYEYWYFKYGKENSAGETVLEWDHATSELMRLGRKTRYDPNAVRGRGSWFETDENGKKRFIYNTGKYLLVESDTGEFLPVKYYDFKGQFAYKANALEIPMVPPSDQMTHAELLRLRQFVFSFAWEEPIHAQYVLGWILMSAISGYLSWRPLMWVTAEAGSGKSFLIEAVYKLLGKASHLFNGSTTDKGIMQTMAIETLSILADEAEANDDASKARSKTLLTACRSAAAASPGTRTVGGSNGNARHSAIRSPAMIASINSVITEDADIQRVLQPRLLKHKDKMSAEDRAALKAHQDVERAYEASLTPIVSSKFISFAIHNSRAIIRVIDKFIDILQLDSGVPRTGKQYGTILACAYFIETLNADASEEDLRAWMRDNGITLNTMIDDNVVTDADRMLTKFLNANVDFEDSAGYRHRNSFHDLIHACFVPGFLGEKIDAKRAEKVLLNNGVAIKREGQRIQISNSFPRILEIFKDTAHSARPCAFLAREFCDADDRPFNKPRYFPTMNSTACTTIKFSKFADKTLIADFDLDLIEKTKMMEIGEDIMKKIKSTLINVVDLDGKPRRETTPILVQLVRDGGDSIRNISQADAQFALEKNGIMSCDGLVMISTNHPGVVRMIGQNTDIGKNYEKYLRSLKHSTREDVDFAGVRTEALCFKWPRIADDANVPNTVKKTEYKEVEALIPEIIPEKKDGNECRAPF